MREDLILLALGLTAVIGIGAWWIRLRRLSPLERLLAAMVAMRVGQDVGQILAELVEQLRGILGARGVLLFYYDAQDEQLYRWGASDPKESASMVELPPVENSVWVDNTALPRLERWHGDHPLAKRLGAESVLSVACGAHGSCARLLALDAARDPGHGADHTLYRLTDLLFSLGQKVFLLRRVHGRAIDQERARIAQDFHDGPLQAFFSIDVHLQFIRQLLTRDPERAALELHSLQTMARDQGRELRELIMEMRPVDLEGVTLAQVLRTVVESSQKAGGISVRLLAGDHHLDVPRKICRQTYQVLREAINNARKHAKAEHVIVKLEEGPDFFTLTVDDDGHGFKFAGKYGLEELDRQRIGPVSIKQRARQMGADLTVESTPGSGSRLILHVPVPKLPHRRRTELPGYDPEAR
jgi:signal transduction histidine kinase